jgi:hypothetical protein
MKIKIPNNKKHMVVLPKNEWLFWQLHPGDTIDIEIVGAWSPDGTPKRAMHTK